MTMCWTTPYRPRPCRWTAPTIEIKPGSWVAIERPLLTDLDTPSGRFVSYHQVQIRSRAASMDTQTGYTAKVTLLTLNPQWLTIRAQNEQLPWLLKSNDVLRETVVYAQGEALTLGAGAARSRGRGRHAVAQRRL